MNGERGGVVTARRRRTDGRREEGAVFLNGGLNGRSGVRRISSAGRRTAGRKEGRREGGAVL